MRHTQYWALPITRPKADQVKAKGQFYRFELIDRPSLSGCHHFPQSLRAKMLLTHVMVTAWADGPDAFPGSLVLASLAHIDYREVGWPIRSAIALDGLKPGPTTCTSGNEM